MQRTSSRGRGRLALRRDVVENRVQRTAVVLGLRQPPIALPRRPISQLWGAHARGRHLVGAGNLLAVLLLAHLRRCRG